MGIGVFATSLILLIKIFIFCNFHKSLFQKCTENTKKMIVYWKKFTRTLLNDARNQVSGTFYFASEKKNSLRNWDRTITQSAVNHAVAP